MTELAPIEIDPRPCELCWRTIDQHQCIDHGEGPEFYCYPDDDIVQLWELADPRDRWRHTGEQAPSAAIRNSDIGQKPKRQQAPRVPQSTIDAFKYVVGLGDPAYLKRWLRDHSEYAVALMKQLGA